MKLNIVFPESMKTEQLLMQERIPCVCKISKNFEISFSDIIPEAIGTVLEWDREELELRAVAGAGGRYTHYANSLITLAALEPDVYNIMSLDFFYVNFGWCAVISKGEYAPPGKFWDDE